MTDKENRLIEILAWLAAIPINYYLFGWYIAIIAAISMFIADFVVNKINKLWK